MKPAPRSSARSGSTPATRWPHSAQAISLRSRDEASIRRERELDGLYVVRTSEPRVAYSVTPTKMATANKGVDGTVTWDVSSCPSTNYHIIYGKGENLALWTVDGGKCAIGVTGSYPWAAIPDPSTYTSKFLWWLVAGDDGGTTEGSWGLKSDGTERGGASASGFCAMATKNTAGVCGTP